MVGKGCSQDAFISSDTKPQSSAENSDLEDNVQLQKDEQFSHLQDTFVSKERPLYSQLQLNSAPTLKSMKASQVPKDCNGGATVDDFQLDPGNTVAEAWEDDGKKVINANPKGSMDNPPAVLSGRGNISNLNLNSNSHGTGFSQPTVNEPRFAAGKELTRPLPNSNLNSLSQKGTFFPPRSISNLYGNLNLKADPNSNLNFPPFVSYPTSKKTPKLQKPSFQTWLPKTKKPEPKPSSSASGAPKSYLEEFTSTMQPHTQMTQPIRNSPATDLASTRDRPWAALFAEKKNSTQFLKFMELSLPSSPEEVECDILEEDVAAVWENWKNALVVFFIRRNPRYLAVKHSSFKSMENKA